MIDKIEIVRYTFRVYKIPKSRKYQQIKNNVKKSQKNKYLERLERKMKLLTINVHAWMEKNQMEKIDILAKTITIPKIQFLIYQIYNFIF